jgi:hypothetical protein
VSPGKGWGLQGDRKGGVPYQSTITPALGLQGDSKGDVPYQNTITPALGLQGDRKGRPYSDGLRLSPGFSRLLKQ